jgi:capsular exopolysaccharide synthesis family protein
MDPSALPLEKRNRNLPEPGNAGEQRLVPSLYVEPPRGEASAAPGYDNLVDYRYVLVRYKMTLLGFAAAGLVAAILISWAQTPLYRARTSLEIQDFNENFLDMKSVDPTSSTGNFTTAESYVETQMKILQSESLLERVIDKLKLHEVPPPTGWRALVSRVHRMLGLSGSSSLPEKEAFIRQAERHLTVSATGHSRLIEVLYESPDPKLAAEFANTLVSEFIEQSQEMRWRSTQRTAEWLTSHLDELKGKLEQSEGQLQDYASTTGLTFTSEKDNVAEVRLKDLQDELSKAEADRVAKEAKYEEARGKPSDSIPEMLEDPTLREYRLKLTDLQRQLVELSATLTPAHYKVQRVQAQITEMQLAAKMERDNILHRMGNEYAAALRRERLLAKARSEQEMVVADQSSKAIHYDTLKREVDSSRQLYEAMLQRVKQAGLAAAMRASNVLVIDPAKPPILPYRPNVPMNYALGLFSGVFLGLGFVLVRERLDRRIQAPGEAEVYLNLPELGAIPVADTPPSRKISDSLHWHRHTQTAPTGRELEPKLDDHPELATWKRKPSLLAECVRATMTSILLLPGKNGDHPRVVVLTSPCPNDGKTTVVSNLSIAMAEIGKRVLLVDGDLRRPRLHTVFGVSNSWGLSDLLWAETPLETAPISHLIRETKVSGLCLLPGGSPSSMVPSNLFYSPRMSRLLARLRREFDMVMIDAPPMIHLADARVLGRMADGVILVIRAGQTTTESVLFASRRFAEDGTRVLGTVLNSWDPNESSSYRYAYGYQGKY